MQNVYIGQVFQVIVSEMTYHCCWAARRVRYGGCVKSATCSVGKFGSRGQLRRSVLLVGLCCVTGCSPYEDYEVNLGARVDALADDNGMSANGLITNGLITNGLITNGLATAGLSPAGLTSSSFTTWFNQNPERYSDMVMRYLVQCALATGERRTWTNPAGSRSTYTWHGQLGLAPDWTSGRPATTAEQQVISACLAAHVNKFGVSVSLSIQGKTAQGRIIPVAPGELRTYSQTEACWFGNLFFNEGVFVGKDHEDLRWNESSVRACGMSSQDSGTSVDCPPLIHVGRCSSLCTRNSSGTRYVTCTYNGKHYLPMTTRLRPQEIYTCGDGTCQVSEKCGSGMRPNDCELDCGPCP
jgi:hypothetical protein